MDITFSQQKQQPKKKLPAAPKTIEELSKSINDIGSRLRVLEERYMNLRKKTQVTDQNLIEAERTQVREIKGLNEDILQVKHRIDEINEKIMVMLGELSNCVTEDEFKVVKRYVELWQPANFVTRDEVKEILREPQE